MKERLDKTQQSVEFYGEEHLGDDMRCPTKEECKELALFSESAYKRIRRAIERVKSGESHAFVEE